MTRNDNAPDTGLPKFPVNVAATNQITPTHLSALLSRYRRGEIEPLIFGDGNKPEAAIIPFAALVRLMTYDQANHVHREAAFQAELSRRAQESDPSAPSMTVEELADSLGPLGRQWADEHRAAQQEKPDE
ncbi:hypothetical protein [Streptomyces sp. NPDC055036]